MLPGPLAQQLATYIGWMMHGTRGDIVAGALFVLPSLVILVVLSWVYIVFGATPLVAGLFYGIKPAVTAIVLHAAHRIGARALYNNWLGGIAMASFVAMFALNMPFPVIVAAAAVIGCIGARVAPQVCKARGEHSGAGASFVPALIDNNTPTPAHALFRWSRLLRVVLAGAAL